MGAGAGQVTYDWFERMYPDVLEAGIGFTAIGVVTADPASVESVLTWTSRLQSQVSYLIVENSITNRPTLPTGAIASRRGNFRRSLNRL